MHFQERNNVVLIVRKPEDPKSKAKPEIVGRFKKTEPALADDIRKKCSAAEVVEIEAFIEQYKKKPRPPEGAGDKAEGAGRKKRAGKGKKNAGEAAGTARAARRAKKKEKKEGSGGDGLDLSDLAKRLQQAAAWFRKQEVTAELRTQAKDVGEKVQRLRRLLQRTGIVERKKKDDADKSPKDAAGSGDSE